MTSIEQVARKLREMSLKNGGKCRGNDETGWRDYRDDAIAILETIREPSEEMLEAAARIDLGPEAQIGGKEYWGAMIGAAIGNG